MITGKEDLYLKPFYKGNVSFYETALILGEEGEAHFLFPIEELIGVYNFGQNIEYVEGKDYILTKNGGIKRLPNSAMPYIEFDKYYIEKADPKAEIPVDNDKVPESIKNKYFAFSEGSYFMNHQICVSYKHKEIWNGNKPVYQGEKISKFIKKLVNKEKPTFLFYGDSITVGCNTSGTEWGDFIEPKMDSFPLLVTHELERIYKTSINYVNTAVGGMTSKWGVDNVEENVCKYKPDLVLIGFGMNDGWLDPEEFKGRLLSMISSTMKVNPNAEFILLSTTVPNPNSTWFKSGVHNFINIMKEIDMPNVCLVDMTTTHLDLLKFKEFKDMTGNNVNHPNDFLARIYAQMILGTLIKDR